MEEFLAYHGTDSECIESIKKSNFLPSTSQIEWLGSGVYFFIEGSFDPLLCAREWAKNSAWDNQKKEFSYDNYSILETEIKGERIVDLRIDTDLCIFEDVRQYILARINTEESKGSFKRLSISAQDNYICNAVTKSMGLDILIHNLYIKTKSQRTGCIDSRIPNSTVLCAKETAHISLDNIKEVENGVVT